MLSEQTVQEGQRLLLRKELLELPISYGSLSVVRKRPAEGAARAAVVLAHGFAQTRYTWHLSRRSFSAYLVSRGYDVFNLELRGHGRSRELGSPLPDAFERHVDEDVPAVAGALAREGYRRFFLVGHSLGGAIGYAAAPALGERLAGLITLAGVFHWGNGARVLEWLTPLLHAADRLHRRAGIGAGPAVRMDLVGRLVARSLFALETGVLSPPLSAWAQGAVEREVAREWLLRAFDRTSGSVLALMGRWAETGEFCDTSGRRDYALEWSRCRVPVLVIAGDSDQLADALLDVRPAYAAAGSPDRTFRIFGQAYDGRPFGHIDLIIGKDAPRTVWRTIADWLDGHA
ncbi:MAG: alpha/beta hydrolase [Myxococcales bacterium]|nr:alpha/beta hydrolase [Myxococcales bacterium]